MKFIIDNWYVIAGLIAALAVAALAVRAFLELPTGGQVAKIKEWLLFAVSVAEEELGSGTGQLKLRLVYDMFVERFPFVAKVISFDTFKVWVDEALVAMREMLEKNEKIAAIITPIEQ